MNRLVAGCGHVLGSVLDGLLEVGNHHGQSRRLQWWMRDLEKEVWFVAGW